jgi:glycosyltransferase involved in cell wall biosynthesis
MPSWTRVTDKHRVAFVLTHPVQYFAPWFRFIHQHVPQVELRVFYGIIPSAASQGAGFGTPFEWDRPLLDGYNSSTLSAQRDGQIAADSFSALDAPSLDSAILEFEPNCVVVPGWHAALYRRAMRVCHRHRIPPLYRGDTNLSSAPSSALARAAWAAHTRARLSEYSAFLSVGVRSREYLRTFGAPELLIFDSPHAVDNNYFGDCLDASERRRRRQRLGLDPDAFTALFVGKLEEHKRPLDVIRAMASVPGALLLVAGAGALEGECRAEAARRGVPVVFTGFLNQSQVREAYTLADCLVVPSRETWGLVVNEAMASGVPAVVSDRAGCAPDLVHDETTGAAFHFGEVDGLGDALGRVRQRIERGENYRAACRARIASYDFAAASRGLLNACARLAYDAEALATNRGKSTQVLALCSHMVVRGGLERQTFEVLATLNRHGAGVHCLLNRWCSSGILPLVERAGASWSPMRSDEELRRRNLSPVAVVRMLWDVVASSGEVLAAAWRHRATHVLVPDFTVTIRAWPALLLLRASGRAVILRVGTAPPLGAFYERLWNVVVDAAVDRIVANSKFIRGEVRALGIAARKVALIRNAVRPDAEVAARTIASRVIYVGQIIPDKGVDLLLDAVALLRTRGLPATLDIVGDIDGWESPSYRGYRERIVNRTHETPLAGAVRLLGYRDDVSTLMAQSAVHCTPSRAAIREGLANVVLEAKAAGVPSVVTSTGSLPELIEHRVDGWIAADDAAAVAEGLQFFLENEAARADAGAEARSSLRRFSRGDFDRAWLEEFGMITADAALVVEPS